MRECKRRRICHNKQEEDRTPGKKKVKNNEVSSGDQAGPCQHQAHLSKPKRNISRADPLDPPRPRIPKQNPHKRELSLPTSNPSTQSPS